MATLLEAGRLRVPSVEEEHRRLLTRTREQLMRARKRIQVQIRMRLIKNFRYFALQLKRSPQALLITQKGSNGLVLVNAEIFEGLVEFQGQAIKAGFHPVADYGDPDKP